jgi:hypothetical protein
VEAKSLGARGAGFTARLRIRIDAAHAAFRAYEVAPDAKLAMQNGFAIDARVCRGLAIQH